MNDEFDNMLFNYETTHRTDYRIRDFQLPLCPRQQKTAPTPSSNVRPPPDALKDTHTLSDWNRDCVPFDLFIKLNEIVRSNPTQIQKAYTKPQDLDREQAQRTRPRLVMTPAVALDGIESKEMRQLLVSDIYQSEYERAWRHAPTTRTLRVLQPFAPANPISLPAPLPARVCSEWRPPSAAWDRRQRRARLDTHKEFFLRRTSQTT